MSYFKIIFFCVHIAVSRALVMHNVPTGYVGITKSWGHIMPTTLPSKNNPHWYNGLTTSILDVEVRPQRDFIQNIRCGTSEGLQIRYPLITVYNQLTEENVIETIDRFGENYDQQLIVEETEGVLIELCSEHTLDEQYNTLFKDLNEMIQTGLEDRLKKKNAKLRITSILLQKPIIPEDIQKNYDKKAEEKTRLEAEKVKKIRQLEEADTERQVAEQTALKEKSVAEINHLKELAQARAEADKRKIEADMAASVKRTQAEADAFYIEKLAEAEKLRHTAAYLQEHWQDNVLKKANAFWGPSLPKYTSGTGVNPVTHDQHSSTIEDVFD